MTINSHPPLELPPGHARGNTRRRWFLGTLFLGLFVLLLWLACDVLILFFASALLAILLRGLSCWLSQRTPLTSGWSLAVILGFLLGGSVLAGWLLAPQIQQQSIKLGQELNKALEHAQEYVAQFPWGRQWLESQPNPSKMNSQITGVVSKASTLLSSGAGLVTYLAVFLFVGIYLAINPGQYINGFLMLIPRPQRRRVGEILEVLGNTMQRWLMGRFLLMAANALVTGLGLWLMGIPLPFTLGVISGILNFIPNIGPILAAIPAVLFGFMQSPMDALYVAVFYVAYQNVDGFVLTPLVQRRTVSLPPALTLMAQVLLGVLLGPMGVVFAVPLTAMGMVIVKMAYVQDVLGEEVELPGQEKT